MEAKIKCGYADRYKATKPPKCGCLTCKLKWLEALQDKNDKKIDECEKSIEDIKGTLDVLGNSLKNYQEFVAKYYQRRPTRYKS